MKHPSISASNLRQLNSRAIEGEECLEEQPNPTSDGQSRTKAFHGNTEALSNFRPIVRAKVASSMIGLGLSAFWARLNPKDPSWDPTFPAPFTLNDSPRSPPLWFADEIQAWIEHRAKISRRTTSVGTTMPSVPHTHEELAAWEKRA